MRRIFLTLVALAWASFPTAAFASLTLTVESAAVQSGSTGFVKVFVRSSAANTDRLDAFTLAVLITPQSGSPNLQFTDPPLDPQLSDPAYIFPLSDSAAASVGPPAGLITSDTNPGDMYLGGDGTLSGAGYFVPTTNTLLATIQVAASTAATHGQRFQISVLTDLSTFFGPLPTNPNLPPNILDAVSVPGVVTAVPEPSSMLSLGGLFAAALLRSTANRRRQRAKG